MIVPGPVCFTKALIVAYSSAIRIWITSSDLAENIPCGENEYQNS